MEDDPRFKRYGGEYLDQKCVKKLTNYVKKEIKKETEKMGLIKEVNEQVVTEENQEESLEQRYSKMVHDLVCKNHWTPRKARRYLDSLAKRDVRKTHKLAKTMPKVDVSDLRETIAAELAAA